MLSDAEFAQHQEVEIEIAFAEDDRLRAEIDRLKVEVEHKQVVVDGLEMVDGLEITLRSQVRELEALECEVSRLKSEAEHLTWERDEARAEAAGLRNEVAGDNLGYLGRAQAANAETAQLRRERDAAREALRLGGEETASEIPEKARPMA